MLAFRSGSLAPFAVKKSQEYPLKQDLRLVGIRKAQATANKFREKSSGASCDLMGRPHALEQFRNRTLIFLDLGCPGGIAHINQKCDR
jgi:hypothetical protein